MTLFFGKSAFAFTFFAILNILGQAFYINHLADRHRLYHHTSFLPAASYVMATSLITAFNYFSAALVANWLLIISLSLVLDCYGKIDARKPLFNIGFYLSLAGLIYFPYAIVFVAAVVGLAMMRPLKPLEWVITLLGFLTPIYFTAAALFLMDHFDYFLQLPLVKIAYPIIFKNLSVIVIAVVVLIVWGIIAGIYLNNYYQKMLQQIKKSWGVILLYTVFAAMSSFISFGNDIAGFIALLAIASLIFANPFFESRKKWIANTLFYCIIAIALALQWMADMINFF